MGRDNVAAVRALCDAYARGDELGVIAALDPEVEWVERDLTMDSPARAYHGRRGVAQAVLAAARARAATEQCTSEQLLVAGEHVVVHGRSRRSVDGRDVELPFTHVFTIRHGRVARLVTYWEPAVEVKKLHALAS